MPLIKKNTLALLLMCCLGATAMASQDLAQKKACMNCHGIDKAVLGPALKDVAKKYRGQQGSEARLAEKVIKGGGGVWKMPMGPMPAQTQVTPNEAKQLVTWIMKLN